jgi:outer membrane immunogenic protein
MNLPSGQIGLGKGTPMKIVLLASAALVALAAAGPAQAQDGKQDGRQASVYMSPLAASSWTGFYLGIGGGARRARTDISTSLVEVVVDQPDNVIFSSDSGSATVQGTTARVSPYAGFNWQIAPQWVAGVEADVGFGRQTAKVTGFPFSPGFGNTGDAGDSQSVKTTWDGSLRGRLGFLVTPVTMAYATAGVAMQHFEVTSTCGVNSCVNNGFNFPVVTKSIDKAGWTLGGGIEVALWSHWLLRAEYRYADLGSQPFSLTRNQFVVPFHFIKDRFDASMRTQTVNFGIAYVFN